MGSRFASARMRAAAVGLVAMVALGQPVLTAGCGASASRSLSRADASPSTSTPSEVGPPSPSTLDPAAVGVSHAIIVDPTRVTAARGDRPQLDRRELQLTIRYPIAGAPGADEVVGAVPLGRSPLVVFAHGFAVSAERYSSLLHDVAAAGFVVVAPDFPMTSDVFDGPPLESDLPQQSLDVDAVIGQLLDGPDPASLIPGMISAAISPGPVGVLGHSDGAVTVLLSAYAPRYRDRRIGAVVAVAGDVSDFGGTWFGADPPPLLAMQAAQDEISPFERSERLVGAAPQAAMLVAIAGVDHLGAVTDPAVVPAVAALIADDLAWRLAGSTDAAARVIVRRDVPPLRLVASHEG